MIYLSDMALLREPKHRHKVFHSMESSLNHAALEQYSRTFSERVVREVYAHQQRVSGPDILLISPVKQVNLFVIKALFEQWQQEIDRLESPYFDYDHEEVQLALEEFMNTLSQHISVAEAELYPLLVTATQDALLLALSPKEYFRRGLDRLNRDKLHIEDVKAWIKYVKINRAPLDALSDRVVGSNGAGVSVDEAGRLLQLKADELPAGLPADYQPAFSQVALLTEQELLETEQPAPPPPEPISEVIEPAPRIEEEETIEAPAPPRTLNDELTSTQRATLADIHQQQKIANIKSYIGVNQRFMFIRELFENNAEAYNQALDELEQQNTYIEAFNYLRNQYAQPNRWKMDSEEVVEFLEIIAKRF